MSILGPQGSGPGAAADEQLSVVQVEPEPRLTERQQVVLDALRRAGESGLEPSEAGAVLHSLKQGRWAHSAEARCLYCARDSLPVLRRLRDLGLARYRGRMRVWQATGELRAEPPRGMLAPDEAIPF